MPQKGLQAAIELLSGLPIDERDNLLDIMAAKDPLMVEVLRNGLVTLEDIQFLTVKMLQELFREINMSDMALALRISSPDLKAHIYSQISSSMKKSIDDTLLGPLKPVNLVQEAQARIIATMREMINNGRLIIDRSGSDPYV
ncbi:MAG: hypothetical protein KAG61_02065 [Bacteriovoracaceae bacterium]|nr:hypothetical protein [Bacteriovoracaceae bacterium]